MLRYQSNELIRIVWQSKRINFISIQNSQTISAEGYTASPLRTGYERVMAHRVDDLYAATAKSDGQVMSIDKDHVSVQFKDGTKTAVELGRRYGAAAGSTIPHLLVSDLKVGQKVKRGDVIAYNTMFFARDTLDPTQVLWKAGVMAKVALMESVDTFEDSSAISESLSAKMSTKMTKVRSIRLAFNQQIRNLVRVGEAVDIESILCTIEDPTAGTSDIFDEASLDTLRLLSSSTPRAKMTGVVEKIEAIYNGDPDEMASTLKSLTKIGDAERASLYQRMGKEKVTGEVEGTYRVDGVALNMDSVAVQVYITGDVSMNAGD